MAQRSVFFFGGGLLLAMLATPGFSQESSPPPEGTQRSIVPDSLMNWWHGDTLSGDWGGRREQLEQLGVLVEGSYVSDTSKVESGGVRRRTTTRSLLAIETTLDLKKLAGIDQAQVFGQFLSKVGPDGNADSGDLQVYDNLDDPSNLHTIAELWWEQRFADGRYRLIVGKRDSNNDFNTNDHTADFIHSSFGPNPGLSLVGMPTYPDPAVGVTGIWDALGADGPVRLQGAIYDGATQAGLRTGTRGARTFFDDPSDLYAIGELQYRWYLGHYPGRVAVGAWRHTGRFDRLRGGSQTGVSGSYVNVDQSLWLEPVAEQVSYQVADRVHKAFHQHPPIEELQGAFMSLRWADTDNDVSPLEHDWAAALIYRGPIPGRDLDLFGVGISRAELNRQPGSGFTENAEVATEIFYRCQLNAWCVLQPDAQWIRNPGGAGLSDLTVFTLRVGLSL